MADAKSLQQQVAEILKRAEEKGVSTNFFFLTTFKRYQVQMSILTDLEAEIAKQGPTVTKEYVKGRGNIYVNPAVTEYNKTSTAANQTVVTLIKIIDAFTAEDAKQEVSKMADFLSQK